MCISRAQISRKNWEEMSFVNEARIFGKQIVLEIIYRFQNVDSFSKFYSFSKYCPIVTILKMGQHFEDGAIF